MHEEELKKLRAQVDAGETAQPDADEDEETDTSSEGSQPEKKSETEDESTDEDAASDADNSQETDEKDPPRIPYSRFESVNEAKIRAEMELELLKQQLAQRDAPSSRTQEISEHNPPSEFLELYGDTPESRNAWKVQMQLDTKRFAAIEESAAKRAVESLKAAQIQEAQEVEERVDDMQSSFDEFSAQNKRPLSDLEQDKILDIIDEFTPKDEQGNYVAHFIPVDKAVEIYDLRSSKSSAKKIESKRKASILAGASSEGEPSSGDKGSHFRAGQWDSWRNNPLLKD